MIESRNPKVTGDKVPVDPDQLQLPNMPQRPESKQAPVIQSYHKGKPIDMTGGAHAKTTDPTTFDSATDNLIMGLAEPRLSAFQRTARDEARDVHIDDGIVGTTHRDNIVDVGSNKEIVPDQDQSLQDILEDEVVQGQVHRAKKGPAGIKGPIEAGLRNPDRSGIDFEGERQTKEIERIRKLTEDGTNDIQGEVNASIASRDINAEIQDTIDLFKKKSESVGMFDIKKLEKAPLQPTKAQKAAADAGDKKAIQEIEVINVNSKLWKQWDGLSNAANAARKGNPDALAKVRQAARWLTKGNPIEQLELFPTHQTSGRGATAAERAATEGLGDARGFELDRGDVIPETKSFKQDDGSFETDAIDPVIPQDAVQFSRGSDINELGPKTVGNLEQHLRRQQSGFSPIINNPESRNVSGAPRRMSMEDLIKFMQQGK